MVDLGSDDGPEQCHEVIERLAATKTQLGTTTRLDDTDIGRSFTETFLVANKMDDVDAAERLALLHELIPMEFREFVISATEGNGLDTLRAAIFAALEIVRVYTKSPMKKEVEFDKPFTLRRGGTLADVASMIHQDIAATLKFGRVWGTAVHDGARVKADYVVQDKDIVEIHY